MKVTVPLSLFFLFTIALNTACSTKETKPRPKANSATISLQNNSSLTHKNTAVYIPFSELGFNIKGVNSLSLTTESGPLAFEVIDRDGDSQKDGIYTLADVQANQNLELSLQPSAHSIQPVKLTQAEISIKDGGKWAPHPNAKGKKAYQGGEFKNVDTVSLPEFYTDHSNWIRYEGPGIESDKVGYRIYLDHRNGFDIFGKKLNKPVLQLIGQDGYASYHNMLDWGMDILKVGSSLGAGGFGFWGGESLTMASDTLSRSARIIENGNLYSSLAIDYGQWLVDGERRDATAMISMHGGSRLAQNRVTLDGSLPNLAIGVVKHQGTEFITGNFDGPYSYIASWGQQSESGDNLGMAVIFKSKNFQRTAEDKSSYVALMAPDEVDGKSVLEYYFVAAWQGEHGNGIANKQQFITYLDSEVQKLSEPIQVTVSHQ